MFSRFVTSESQGNIAVSIPAARVIVFLTQTIDLHGRLSAIRCDNGPELTSQAFVE